MRGGVGYWAISWLIYFLFPFKRTQIIFLKFMSLSFILITLCTLLPPPLKVGPGSEWTFLKIQEMIDKLNVHQSLDSFYDVDRLFQANSKGLNLLCMNIRSYIKKFDSLLVQLNSVTRKFDIIILYEFWLGKGGLAFHLIRRVINPCQRPRGKTGVMVCWCMWASVCLSWREVEPGDMYDLWPQCPLYLH